MIRQRLRRYFETPDTPEGAVLNPERGYFSVIVPIERTNLILNPSCELDGVGYSASGGGALTRATGASVYGPSASYYGVYSISTTPATSTGGLFYTTSTLTSGAVYAASMRFLGTPGAKYKFSIATTGGVDLTAYSFRATGRWQWIWLYYKETSATTRRIYVLADSDATAAVNGLYVDGLQLEVITAGETVSTYIDGDQEGLLIGQDPPAYFWNGTPHASTSTRRAATRAGGMVYNLDRFRFRVQGYAGGGLTAVSNIVAVPAASDGSLYQATIAQSRQLAIKGFFDAATPAALDRVRTDAYNALGPDSAAVRQPCVLVVQKYDGQRPIGSEGRLIATYERGLEGNQTNNHHEDATIVFSQQQPVVLAGDCGAALGVQTGVNNANAIIQRSATGVWSALSGGVSTGTSVRALVYGPDGTLYAGGDFTAMDAVANTDGIAKWNGTAWSALGTGPTAGVVRALAIGPDGTLYAGGSFTDMGGVANTPRIAKWNGTAWSAMGTGGSGGDVLAIAIGVDGSVYAGGSFTLMGGVANTVRIAKWNGTAWSALSTGMTGGVSPEVDALVVGFDTNLYASGAFTTAGGVAAASIAYWDGTTWAAMGTGLNGSGLALAMGPSGLLYAGGTFTTAGGVTANFIAQWNGSGWAPLANGLSAQVYSLAFVRGALYVAGQFASANGVTFPDGMAMWNGSSFVALDVNTPATIIYALASSIDGKLVAGYDASGAATAASVTTVTNLGTARAFPRIRITGPSSGSARIYQVGNTLTGNIVYLNLTINAGEVDILKATPGGVSIQSTFRGNVSGAVLPGSASDFTLAKGANTISVFSSVSTVTAIMSWTTGYQSLADLTD